VKLPAGPNRLPPVTDQGRSGAPLGPSDGAAGLGRREYRGAESRGNPDGADRLPAAARREARTWREGRLGPDARRREAAEVTGRQPRRRFIVQVIWPPGLRVPPAGRRFIVVRMWPRGLSGFTFWELSWVVL